MNIANPLSKSVLPRFFGPVIALAILFGIGLGATPLRAQQQGPIGPPPASSDSSGSPVMVNHGSAIPIERGGAHTATAITSEPPSLPADQIIQIFSPHRSEFPKKRDNTAY